MRRPRAPGWPQPSHREKSRSGSSQRKESRLRKPFAAGAERRSEGEPRSDGLEAAGVQPASEYRVGGRALDTRPRARLKERVRGYGTQSATKMFVS